jgi:uncharacterized metal-binding protein YceD (DUF177 family)
MGKFDAYNIPLKTLELGKSEYEFHLDNAFFALIGEEEIQKGDLKAIVTVEKNEKESRLHFTITGKVVVTCNRCLEEMDQPISSSSSLIVRFGKEFKDDGDDVVVVPEDPGSINVSWFLYEFTVLAIPVKHVHPYGLCNKEMSSKLSEHLVEDVSEDDASYQEDGMSDPRWNALKNLRNEDSMD